MRKLKKKRNMQDATLLNIRALKRRVEDLEYDLCYVVERLSDVLAIFKEVADARIERARQPKRRSKKK